MWDQIKTKSNLVFRSIGIVTENKERGTNTVEICPIEIVPDISSELTVETVNEERGGANFFDDSTYKVNVDFGGSIPAVWVGETNRLTSPDVRRGEQVRLFQLGDSDEWFWESLGRDDDLRRLETVIFTINANPENVDADVSPDNSYSIEYSAHDKHITLRTSMANGEYCSYIAQFNLKDGKYVIEDNEENHILLDTKNTNIQLKNSEESLLSLNKTNIKVFSKDTIGFETTDFSIDAKTVTVNCDKYKITAPDMKHIGNSLFDGDLEVTGKATLGQLEVKGDSKMKGVKLSGDIKSSGGASFAKPCTAPNI